jgi:hypothetical protein
MFAAQVDPVTNVICMVLIGIAFYGGIGFLLYKRSQQKREEQARKEEKFEQFRKEATPEEWQRYLMEKERAEERKDQKRQQQLATGASILMNFLKK